jgi:hypothetical protein
MACKAPCSLSRSSEEADYRSGLAASGPSTTACSGVVSRSARADQINCDGRVLAEGCRWPDRQRIHRADWTPLHCPPLATMDFAQLDFSTKISTQATPQVHAQTTRNPC